MKFKYLQHTSEAKFRAYGKNLEEAFGNAALAIFNMVTDISKVKTIKKISFNVTSEKIEALLFDFVDKLIFYQDTKGMIVSKVKKISIEKDNNKFILHAELLWDNYANYETHGHIKAPTYSDMFIKKQKNRCTVQMVVDV